MLRTVLHSPRGQISSATRSLFLQKGVPEASVETWYDARESSIEVQDAIRAPVWRQKRVYSSELAPRLGTSDAMCRPSCSQLHV